jgi:hypothetical protein
MGLFHKYDIDRDTLRLDYDYVNKCVYYSAIKDGKWFPVVSKDLSRKTRKLLESKNRDKMYLDDLEKKYEYQTRNRERIKKYTEAGLNGFGFEVLGKVTGTMSSEFEKYFSKLIEDSEECVLGIHRTSESAESIVPKVFSEGLIINGHCMGAARGEPSLKDTISYYPDNRTIGKELMHADAYKNSRGSFLVRIPFNDFSNGSNIYIEKDGKVFLNPIYIVGYVPLEEGNHISEIIKNPSSCYRSNDYSYKYQEGEVREVISFGKASTSKNGR